MKLLCVADVHLGSVPTRLPAQLQGRASELGPAAAWRRAVEYALQQQVSAVLLAGDLVDGNNDFFEAFSALRDGVMRLADAGVQVLAVAGNHDTEVLARLVAAVPQVRLVGAGAEWEAVDVAGPSQSECVRVVGWSFADRWADRSPLHGSGLSDAVSSPVTDRHPMATIGLLHADRDQSGSRYAPVSSSQLANAPVDVWLLGHVHKPDVSLTRGAWGRGGYLGSLASCDPGEHGARGAWLLEIQAGGSVEMRHVPLAPLRWEHVQIDISAFESADQVVGQLVSSVEQLVQGLMAEGAHPEAVGENAMTLGLMPEAVGCRVRLVGRSPIRSQIAAALLADPPTDNLLTVGGVDVFFDRVSLEALPAVDLVELASNADPLGLMAERILALQNPDSDLRKRMIDQARPRVEAVYTERWAKGAPVTSPTDDELAQLLEEAALNSLDALLEQRPGAADGGAA